MANVVDEWREPQLLELDVERTQSPLSWWWILAVLTVGGSGGVMVLASGVAPVEPRVEISSNDACAWSGAEVIAGLVDIQFVNNSRQTSWVKFSPMVEGVTVDDVVAATPATGDLHDYERLPVFLDRGHNTRGIEPGSSLTFKVALTRPVYYAVSCSRTEPTFVDGVPTVASKVLRVLPAE